MEIAYQELLDLKDALPTGHVVGHRSILAYCDILASAEKRTGDNLAQFFINDALRPIRVSPESPVEYICAKKIFLREMERALEYVSKHIST